MGFYLASEIARSSRDCEGWHAVVFLAHPLPLRAPGMSFVWAGGIDTLRGDLVSVREVVDRDAPTLFEMLTDPQVAEHMSPPPPTVDAFRGFVVWARKQRAAGEGMCFGIVPHGLDSAVGIVQLRAHEPSWFTAEWG